MISKEQARKEFSRFSVFDNFHRLTEEALIEGAEILSTADSYEICRQVVSDFLNEEKREKVPRGPAIRKALQAEKDRKNPQTWKPTWKIRPDCEKCEDTGWRHGVKTVKAGGELVDYSYVWACDCKSANPSLRGKERPA